MATVLSATAAIVGIAACGSGRAHPQPSRRAPATTTTAFVRPPAGIGTVQLFQPMGFYTEYVEGLFTRLRPQLAALQNAIASGDVTAARHDWVTGHLLWLEIGQDDGAYGAFGPLGGKIDATATGDVGGTASTRFTGFHKVEYDLFRTRDLTAAAHDAAVLSALVGSINQHTLNTDLALTSTSLDAWVLRCHEILEDALRDSLSDEDDYGSGTDLEDVGADVTATREMLSVLSGVITPRAPGLEAKGRAELSAIDTAIDAGHRPGTTWREPSALPLRARQRLNAAVGAALETLAPVSELLQISNVNG